MESLSVQSMQSMWLFQLIRQHLNQQALWQGTQSLVKKSYSRHSHCMSLALMHCGNLLTIQFQARTPAVYTVPQLLPSSNRFTFIRPHTSIKGRKEGIRSSISCQKLASKVWGSGGEGKKESEEQEGRTGSLSDHHSSVSVGGWGHCYAGNICNMCTSRHTGVWSWWIKENKHWYFQWG